MGNSVLRTAVFFSIASLITQVIGLLSQLILMRKLNLADYGEYGLAFECFIMLQLIVFNSYRNLFLQDFRGGDNNIWEKTKYQFLNGGVIIIFLGAFLCYLFRIDIIISFFLIISVLLSSVIVPLFAKFLVDGKRLILVLKDIFSSLVVLLCTLITVFVLNLNVKSVIIIQMMSSALLSLLLFFLLFKHQHVGMIKFIKKEDFYFKFDYTLFVFLLIFLINVSYNKIGIISLSNFSGMAAVALYLAAFKFISPALFIQNSLIQAYIPNFVSNKKMNFNYKVFLHFSIPGVFLMLCLFLFYPYILLVLGLDKYLSSYNLVKILSFYLPAVFVYGALSNYISIIGGQKTILFVNSIVLVVYGVSVVVMNKLGVVNPINIAFLFVFLEILICLLYYFYLIFKKVEISYLFVFYPFILFFVVFLVWSGSV